MVTNLTSREKNGSNSSSSKMWPTLLQKCFFVLTEAKIKKRNIGGVKTSIFLKSKFELQVGQQ